MNSKLCHVELCRSPNAERFQVLNIHLAISLDNLTNASRKYKMNRLSS